MNDSLGRVKVDASGRCRDEVMTELKIDPAVDRRLRNGKVGIV